MQFFDPKHDPAPGWVTAPEAKGLAMDSHGDIIFGRVLTPALYENEGPRPVVVLCHGFPGQEQNIDLAQALRRAGYYVVYFSYRGVWGSHGNYAFTHLIEDVHTVVDYVRSGKTGLPLDTENICLIGHSMGGFAALNALATGLQVKKAILMAPCDHASRYFANREKFLAGLPGKATNGIFHVEHPNVWVEEFEAHAGDWHFPNLVPRLPRIPYRFIGGLRDALTPPEQHIKPLLGKLQAAGFDTEYHTFDDGHSFPANRVALADLAAKLLQE